jgi:SAM-dependent methyltransferase
MTPHGHGTHADHEAAWEGRAAAYAAESDAFQRRSGPQVDAALLDAAQVGPGMRVLDIACGAGHTTAAAAARGADALGVDRSPSMVAAARERHPGVRFAVGDMLRPPAGPWDAIVCRFGAHHAGAEWLAAARHALRPGGRLALAEPRQAPHGDMPGKRDAAGWVAALRAAGFEDVEASTVDVAPPAPGADDGHPLRGPVLVVRGRRPLGGPRMPNR